MKTILTILLLTSSLGLAQEPEKKPAEAAPIEQKQNAIPSFRFALGGSYSLGSRMIIKDTYLSSSSVYDAELDLTDAFAIDVDARMMDKYRWGVIIGVSYDMERKVTGGTSKLNGSIVPTSTTNQATIQATVGYANLVYQWDEVYVPFGLNLAAVKFSPGSTLDSTASMKTYMGTQFGIGFMLNEHVAFEAILRMVSLNLSAAGTPADKKEKTFTNGYLSTTNVSVKYVF